MIRAAGGEPATRQEESTLRSGGLWRDKALVTILLLAALLRFGFGLAAMDGKVPQTWQTSGDQYSYWYYGNEMAHGRGYISYVTHKASSYYPVGWPASLAATYWTVDHTPLPNSQQRATAFLNALMSTLTVLFVWLIARAALARRYALLATAIVAFFPSLIFGVATYSVETAFIFWATAALAVIATHDWSSGPPSTRRLLAFGAVLGCSVLVRPFALPFVIGLAIALLVVRAGWRKTLASLGIVFIPVVALIIPWTIRNELHMHAFVPISTNLGDTVCLDRSLNANGGFRWAVEGCAAPNLPEAPRNRQNINHAVKFVVHHPKKELWLMGQRLRYIMANDQSTLLETETVNGRVFTAGERRVVVNLTDWYFRVVIALGVVGLVGLFRPGPRAPQRLLVATAAVFLIWIPVELWGAVRFHVPLLPFAAICAAAAPLAFVGARDPDAAATTPAEPEPEPSPTVDALSTPVRFSDGAAN